MKDKTVYTEAMETEDLEEVNGLLASGDWALIDTASGQRPDGSPYFRYLLAKPYRKPEPDMPWI